MHRCLPRTPGTAEVQILDQVASQDGLTLSGSAEAGSTVELWAGETRLASVPVDASGVWTTTVQTELGENQIVARSVSIDGTTLSELKVVVLEDSESTPQATAVVVKIDSPIVAPDGEVTLSGTAEAGSTVELWSGEEKLAVVPVDAEGNWIYTGQLKPGDYQIQARVVSVDGQVISVSEAVVVTIEEAAPVTDVPVVIIETIDVEPGGAASLSGTAPAGSTVELWAGETKLAEIPVDENGQWSYTGQLESGDNPIVVRTVSLDGAVLNESAVEVITVPTAVPATEIAGETNVTPTAESAASAEGGQSYIVKRGDWLRQLARRFYGDAGRWVDIYNATNEMAVRDRSFHRIGNPNLLMPGWKIWIPQP